MSDEVIKPRQESPLTAREGTYIGFGPTDESGVGLGELEVTIDSQAIKFRMATGLEIMEDEFEINDANELSPEEIMLLFEDSVDLPEDLKVFRVGEVKHFLFSNEEADSPVLTIIGGMGDLLGPTLLYSPEQVEAGRHEKSFEIIETHYGDESGIPRLQNNGRAKNS